MKRLAAIFLVAGSLSGVAPVAAIAAPPVGGDDSGLCSVWLLRPYCE